MSKTAVGKFLDPKKKYTRDAIHVPIIPAVIGEGQHLKPGDRVDYRNGKAYLSKTHKDYMGVIDPFLILDDYSYIEPNKQFYIFLKFIYF